MTAEERASWKRWHETGRRRFQVRGALGGFGVAALIALFNISRYPAANPLGPAAIAVVWGISCYFFAGHHWDARDEEYREPAARDDQA